jgi:hypothetical protein
MLSERLDVVSRLWFGPSATSTEDVSDKLGILIEVAEYAKDRNAHFWLLFSVVAGAYPLAEELRHVSREVQLATSVDEKVAAFLAGTVRAASTVGDWERQLLVFDDEVLVDVHFCAHNSHNTGVQRVVRRSIPFLTERGASIVGWTARSGAFQGLDESQARRVLRWGSAEGGGTEHHHKDALIIPWDSDVVLPEVALRSYSGRLACLAEYSGNRITMIGHDTIPIGSADSVSGEESERFAHYLTIVKHSDRVLAVSESAAREFRGFASTLPAQGLTGPKVEPVPLPVELPTGASVDHEHDFFALDAPLVVCVGSHEPRKNQDAVLHAVETLLIEGLKFRAVFVGGGDRSRTAAFDRTLRQHRREHGWDVVSVRGLGDDALWALYRQARFSVLVSLHEGFGLPVAESLSFGTPVLTSAHGSTAEIASSGGCLIVDSRDDDAVIAGMRYLLLNDELIAILTQEAESLPQRGWADYASEVWNHIRGDAR